MKNFGKISLFLLFFNILSSNGQERFFAYATSTHIAENGKVEYLVWNTLRLQKAEYFRELDTRLQFEIGLGKNLEAAVFFNNAVSSYHNKEALLGGNYNVSLSGELKLRLGNQLHHRYSSALLEEVTFSEENYKFLTKLLLDRKTHAGFQALNMAYEVEMRKQWQDLGLESGLENKFEIVYGRALHATKDFNIGIELREDALIDKHVKLESSTFFAGPAVSYHSKHIACSLNVMPQIYALADETVNHLNLKHHEKLETRFIISF